MYDFIRVAGAVPAVIPGDVTGNTEKILQKVQEADKAGADLISLPELCVTGYTCGDLFFQQTLADAAAAAIRTLAKESAKLSAVITVGTPLVLFGGLYNCAVVMAKGEIAGIVPKTFLPNYNEFYEKRWFSSAKELTAKTLSAKAAGLTDGEDYEIPVGNDLIFRIGEGASFGVEICEDLWTALPPSTFLTLGGAQIILNPSASNEIIAKRDYRRDLVKQQSARCLCGYVYTSAGETESTTDLVFSGHNLIAERGGILAENQSVTEAQSLMITDIDLGRIRADRQKITTFRDSAAQYGQVHPCRTVIIDDAKPLRSDGTLRAISRHPFIPSDKKRRLERCRDIFDMQVAALKKRLTVTNSKAVIGVSGGLDSTLALLVSYEAIRQLGRPVTDLVGITLPCFGTSDRTYNNAVALMGSLGITVKEINIRNACLLHCEDIGHDPRKLDVTYENLQARERTQVLMDYASEIGGLVVGTGDLSELALGWCTYNADHMSMYGVNAGVPKTLIRWMIDSMIEYGLFPKSTEILKDIVDTPISPELLPPDAEGKISQQTEDLVGPYELHDFFLYYAIRFGFTPEKIRYLARLAFAGAYEDAVIDKWLASFYKRFFTQQFKRSCQPDGVKVGSVALSPRGDWRMPSDASSASWLKWTE